MTAIAPTPFGGCAPLRCALLGRAAVCCWRDRRRCRRSPTGSRRAMLGCASTTSRAWTRGDVQPGQRHAARGRWHRRQGAVPGLRFPRRFRLRRHPARPGRSTIRTNYAFSFQLRGDSPANDLQIQARRRQRRQRVVGQRPSYDFPTQWTEVRYKKRQIDKAWGPDPDTRAAAQREARVHHLQPCRRQGLGLFRRAAPRAVAPEDDSAVDRDRQRDAATAMRLRPSMAIRSTAWRRQRRRDAIMLDLGSVREFGGLTLHWRDGALRIALCRRSCPTTAGDWRDVRDGDRRQRRHRLDRIAGIRSALPAASLVQGGPTQALRIVARSTIEPLAFAATPNDFIKSVAAQLAARLVPARVQRRAAVLDHRRRRWRQRAGIDRRGRRDRGRQGRLQHRTVRGRRRQAA